MVLVLVLVLCPPPQVLCGNDYNHRADVYSFGVVLWEIVHREPPFHGMNSWAIAYQVGTQGRRLAIPAHADGPSPPPVTPAPHYTYYGKCGLAIAAHGPGRTHVPHGIVNAARNTALHITHHTVRNTTCEAGRPCYADDL